MNHCPLYKEEKLKGTSVLKTEEKPEDEGSGCNQEKAEPEKIVSEAMTYRQLVRDYAERKGLSESNAEAGAAVMQLEGLSTENEKYRIVSLPETVEKENYLLWLVMITDESEKDWKIKSVESAWVEKVDDESQLYAGPVQYWIRGERQLQYVVNGDFLCRAGFVCNGNCFGTKKGLK